MFKIVPMEGATPVNGEQQKCAADILAEVDISLRLSRLRGEPGAPPAVSGPDWASTAAPALYSVLRALRLQTTGTPLTKMSAEIISSPLS